MLRTAILVCAVVRVCRVMGVTEWVKLTPKGQWLVEALMLWVTPGRG
jgi:hypothetical protein